MARINCYSKAEFEDIMSVNGWDDYYIPDNVAIISICDPYDPRSDSWMHQFKHNNINVFNLNIDDFDPIEMSKLYETLPQAHNGTIILKEIAPDEWICEEHYSELTNKLYIFNPNQAFGLASFIQKNIGKDFYIHCMAGQSRSMGVVKYILEKYPEYYTYNNVNKKDFSHANLWITKLLHKQLCPFGYTF